MERSERIYTAAEVEQLLADSEKVNAQVLAGVCSNLAGAATQSWVQQQNYLTSVEFPDYSNTYQAKGDYLTAADLPDYSNTYQAVGDYVLSETLSNYQPAGDYVAIDSDTNSVNLDNTTYCNNKLIVKGQGINAQTTGNGFAFMNSNNYIPFYGGLVSANTFACRFNGNTAALKQNLHSNYPIFEINQLTKNGGCVNLYDEVNILSTSDPNYSGSGTHSSGGNLNVAGSLNINKNSGEAINITREITSRNHIYKIQEFVGSYGAATFNRLTDGVTDAQLAFRHDGITIKYSGAEGTSATTTYTVATKEWVNAQIEALKQQLGIN